MEAVVPGRMQEGNGEAGGAATVSLTVPLGPDPCVSQTEVLRGRL